MLKEPRPGRVKTRLGKDIGHVAAASWFRHQSADLIRRLRDPRWSLTLAVTPDTAISSRVWPMSQQRLGQGTGDLGERMARVFRSAPPGPVCIVGADIPAIETSHIAEAFSRLGDHDAVFGPAPDGGFWLVGVKHANPLPAGLFQGVRWSSPHALADSVATFGDCRVGYCAQLRDVDTVDDLP